MKKLIFLVSLFCLVSAMRGADGTLDTTFNTPLGYNLINLSGLSYGVFVQDDGKIVVVGQNFTPSGAFVARYISTGQLDETFNPSGSTAGILEIGTIGQIAVTGFNAVMVQPDRSIIAVGQGLDTLSNQAFITMKITQDGSIDTSFNSGMPAVAFENNFNTARAVALDHNNNIVVVGDLNGSSVAVARYTQSGALDTSFNTTGTFSFQVVVDDVPQSFNRGAAVAIQSNNEIIIAGITSATDLTQVFLAELLNDGSFDTSFTGGGAQPGVVIDTNSNTDESFSEAVNGLGLAIQANGKLIIAHTIFDSTISTNCAEVICFNPSGSFDFRTVLLPVGSITATFSPALVLQSDGNIIIGGIANSTSMELILLARFSPAGVLDLTFGTNGISTAQIATNVVSTAYAVALQQNGSIIISGFTANPHPFGPVLARFINSHPEEPTIITDPTVTISGTAQALSTIEVFNASDNSLICIAVSDMGSWSCTGTISAGEILYAVAHYASGKVNILSADAAVCISTLPESPFTQALRTKYCSC